MRSAKNIPAVSGVFRRGRIGWLLGLMLLFVLVCVFVGAADLSLADWRTEIGRAIFKLRLMRLVTAFIVGAALACSGTVLQALLRNPLADPYVLGVSGGAALGAALAIVMGAAGAWLLAASAFGAAVLALLVVCLLAFQKGGTSVYSLLLSGVIVSAICSSLLMLIVSLAPVEGLHTITWWMLGNLQGGSAALVMIACCLTFGGTLGVWLLARDLNAMTLGRDMAHHLGVRTNRVVLIGLGLATLLTAAAVALAGLIGFVGLIVPHVMRGVVGSDHRRLIVASAVGGGLFLVFCDTLARTLAAPIEIPVGVLTALAGGPFFLILLRRRRHGWLE